MKLYIFALRDVKTAAFMNPMTFQARGQVIRGISDEINGVNGSGSPTDSVLRNHPEDFELYQLAEFDTDSGAIIPSKESICSCADLRIRSN